MARFGLAGLPSIAHLVKRFSTEEAKALLAGVGAHAMLPLEAPLTSAFGIFLTIAAHAGGWPLVQGGSAGLVDGRRRRAHRARSHAAHREMDKRPRGATAGTGFSLRHFHRDAPRRGRGTPPRHAIGDALAHFRHGPGICKVDWALSGPVPWEASVCRRAGTVHVGGSFAEVASSEADVAAGRHSDRPYCLVVQPGVVDSTRAPTGQETLWAYCHVPRGSTVDMTERIEAQIERFAPGFKDLVLARSTVTAMDAEASQPQLRGRRHHRGCRDVSPDGLPSDHAVEPIPDRRQGHLFVLCFHSSRWRRPRDVRRRRGPSSSRRSQASPTTLSPVRALGA